MKKIAFTIVLLFAATSHSQGDIFYTTSTLDSADLDFDGSGMETDGSLTGASRSFSFAGNDVPSQLINVDSFTITFQPSGDSGFSSRGPNGSGIGIEFQDTTAEETGSLDNDGHERIFVNITFVSGDPNQEVFMTGLSLISFDDSTSQAILFGATHSGGSNLIQSSTNPSTFFDNGVASFSFMSNGTESFRMSGIHVSAALTAIPEPSSAILLVSISLALSIHRRKTR